MYIVGIYTGGQMTGCTLATTDYAEAVKEARKTDKNVYLKKGDKFFLRKIFAIRNPI